MNGLELHRLVRLYQTYLEQLATAKDKPVLRARILRKLEHIKGLLKSHGAALEEGEVGNYGDS